MLAVQERPNREGDDHQRDECARADEFVAGSIVGRWGVRGRDRHRRRGLSGTRRGLIPTAVDARPRVGIDRTLASDTRFSVSHTTFLCRPLAATAVPRPTMPPCFLPTNTSVRIA